MPVALAISARSAMNLTQQAQTVAALAVACLWLEVETWPKPGLVSDMDSGSHTDMDAGLLRRSAVAIGPYLHRLVEAGAEDCSLGRLKVVGLKAEVAMLSETGGVNTHRGAIFGMGLLCAAAGARAARRVDPLIPLGTVVARLWGRDLLEGPGLRHSHGAKVFQRYGAGGARSEAARGFPSVYEIALPALQMGALLAPGDAEAARVQACFSLIAALEDTNLLHRGGTFGLRFAQDAARGFLENGGVAQHDWRKRAVAVHRSFIARNLSPGGAADLLAMALFVQACDTPSPAVCRTSS